MPRLTGVLVRIKDEGYGLIRPDDGSPDYFVSINSMRNRADWREETRVSFQPGIAQRPQHPGEKSKAAPALDVVALETRVQRRSQRRHAQSPAEIPA
jgi:cold shock CspA family protein